MNHIMLDLETMGLGGKSAIVSIGAVAFDLKNETLGETFYTNVDLSSCLEYGLEVDGATIAWWVSQSSEAKQSLFKDVKPLDDALRSFTQFVKQFDKVNVWGNGLGFDNVIIKNAYVAVEQEKPWNDFQDRDMRTIIDITESIHGKQNFIKEGVVHNALYDAINQARFVSQCWKILKNNR